MRKFYFYAQFVAAPTVPFFFVFSPIWFDLQSSWPSDLSYLVMGFVLLVGLFAVSLLTLRTSNLTGVKELSVRLSVLLETIYVSVVALLLTAGVNGGSMSAVVSVLTNRDYSESQAWFANDVARVVLFIVIFFFLTAAVFSALKERVAVTHRSVRRFRIVDVDEEADTILRDVFDEDNGDNSSR